MKSDFSMSNWTLFSNHGHVLVCLARNPKARLRDVAGDVGITERAVQKIVSDLHSGGMVNVSKHGRRNHYRIRYRQNLRHDLEANCTLGELLKCVSPATPSHRDTAKPEISQPAKTEPAAKKDVKPDPEEPLVSKQKENKNIKAEQEPAETRSDESIEKQQGLLF